MAQQPNLFPPNPEDQRQAGSQQPAASVSRAHDNLPPAQAAAQPGTPWMVRVEVIIRIIVRLYLGILVAALPWLTIWTQNNLFTYSATLLTLASSGFVRGAVSGLGLLNIVLAVLEAKHARELS